MGTDEGPRSRNPLAFKHDNPDERVDGKSMRGHLRFAAAYWHVMRNPPGDPFGPGTALMPWDERTDSVDNARKGVRVFFEFLEKSGIDFYCFHDRDVAPELGTLAESNEALDAVVETLAEEQARTGRTLRLCGETRRAEQLAPKTFLPVKPAVKGRLGAIAPGMVATSAGPADGR
ncbi:MAG: hypothetical protein JHC52_03995 [Chthoniobacterales bacterium]|nr:hypothetical protein [Chthoniobacterales bacterium]